MAEYSKRRSGSLGSHASQDRIKKDNQERKKAILYLILDYLKDNNMLVSYETLKKEGQINDQYTLCDNIDLDIIVQEYQTYYSVKFNRDPRIIRRTTAEDNIQIVSVKPKTSSGSKQKTSIPHEHPKEMNKMGTDDFHFEVISMESMERNIATGSRRRSSQLTDQEKKQLTDFSGYTQEWREMADQVMREFIPTISGHSWEECVGLEKPVELIKEATVYPLCYPELFENMTSTWNGVLLYGPPGTGKTLLAKTLACEGNTSFINVTSSAFISKWRGESEKMIKVMFDLAKLYAPTTIFIDEIDGLLSETNTTNHEASGRFKSELLIQMDGILSSSESVFILATTNSPWKLDMALLRRFEKRILIPLPNADARVQMFKLYAKWKSDNKDDWNNFIRLTENFSGSDLKNLCKEMEIDLVREQLKAVREKNKTIPRRKLSLDDILKAVRTTKPITTKEYHNKLMEWHTQYGTDRC